MKKLRIATLIAALAFTAVLNSCDGSANVTPLIYGQLGGGLVEIDYAQLSAKVEAEENFMVFSTPTGNCTCWANFRTSVLPPYLEENDVLAFYINFRQFYNVNNELLDSFGIDIYSDRQTLALFKDGEAKTVEVYDSKYAIWSERLAFEAYIDELITLPTIINVDEVQLEGLYAQTSSFAIYFYDEDVQSSFLNQRMLKDYSLSHRQMSKLYAVDCNVSGIKLSAGGAYDETQWRAFKDDYGLSDLDNHARGYGAGVVPTFLYVTPNGVDKIDSVIATSSVYLNDILSTAPVDGEYEIADSYFASERLANLPHLAAYQDTKVLVGLKVPEADVVPDGDIVAWSSEKAAVYHDLLLMAFLDYSLPLATYLPE